MSASQADALLPAAACIRVPPEGEPFLEGVRCAACGEVHIGAFRACPACAGRGSLSPHRLADAGRLHSFSIVHRSFPGVPTPFVSAVVALEGGGFLKGNLEGVAPKPEAVAAVRRVRVVLHEAAARDAKGRRYLTYAFQPHERQD